MKQHASVYRVIVPTVLIGTVRASKGDLVRRELLGSQLRKMLDSGIIEPVVAADARKSMISLM